MAVQKSLQQILRSLSPVGRADSVYEVANADRINAIQTAIRLLSRGDQIVAGNNMRKRSSDGYVVVSGQPGGRRRGGITLNFPWKIKVYQDPPGTYNAKLNPGTLNSMFPVNMFNIFSVPSDGLFYVTLDATTDGLEVTSCEIDISTTIPNPIATTPDLAPTDFTVTLGIIFQYIPFQLIQQLILATPDEVIRTLKTTLVPGQPIWTFNYTWVIDLL